MDLSGPQPSDPRHLKAEGTDVAETYANAQRDLILLVGHAVRQPNVSDLDIEKVRCSISLCSKRSAELKAQEAAELWVLLDYFSRYLRPASIGGLRLSGDASKATAIQKSIVRRNYSLLFFFLPITILLQCYTLFGASSLLKIDANAKTLQALQEKIKSMEAIKPELASINKTDGDFKSRTAVYRDDIEYLRTLRAYLSADVDQCFAYRTMYQFNGLWGWPAAYLAWESPRTFWPVEEPCWTKSDKTRTTEAEHPDSEMTKDSKAMAPVIREKGNFLCTKHAMAENLLCNHWC